MNQRHSAPGIAGSLRAGAWGRLAAPLLLALVLLPHTPLARAESVADLRARLQAAGLDENDVRRMVESGALSPADVERMLRERGSHRGGADAPPAAAPASPAPAGAAAAGAPDVPAWSPQPNRSAEDTARVAARAGGLEPFGFEIFGYSPTTFEPLAYGPVDPDYVVGPGDELALTLWGDDQLDANLPIGRDGAVTVPLAGRVSVAGLTLAGARARLRATLARHYSGLGADGRSGSTRLEVTLGKLRSIQVFILGDVARPGGYTVSSVARVLNALYAAGGPSRTGSMRDVRVLRGGQVLTHVDLYDYVLGGDTSHEARLESGDVIFVPSAITRVTLQGAVRRPAVYELREGERMATLLRLAGGPLTTADLSRAQVRRVLPYDQRAAHPGTDRIAIDLPLGDVLAGRSADTPLQDLDDVTVFALGGRATNTVRITGSSVVRPGTFAWHAGLTVRGLVEAAGGLQPEAFLGRAQIVRTLEDSTRTVLRLDLGRALAGDPGHDLVLAPLDSLGVASKWEMRQRYDVTIEGSVRRPGPYEFLEGMTLGDLLFKAGGLADPAYALHAEVARIDSVDHAGGRLADTLVVALDRADADDPGSGGFVLRPRDAVFIRRNPDYVEPEYVTLRGELRFPGRYALRRRGERLAEVVLRAGGLTPQAYPEGATFARGEGAGRLSVRLPEALHSQHSRDNLVLQNGDVLDVPVYQPMVKVEGAVRNPVSVLYRPGQGADYYVIQASGYLPEAARGSAVVVAPGGDVLRAHRFLVGGPRLQPGSRVVVPFSPPRERSEPLKDFASLLAILTGSLTTVYLIRQVSK